MRASVRLFYETFEIKYLLAVPFAIFILIYAASGSFTVSDVINPTNFGAITMMIIFSFDSRKDLITLLKLLPEKPGSITAVLQAALYLILIILSTGIFIMALLVEIVSPSGEAIWQTALCLLLNTIFMTMLCNIMVPVLLFNRCKPLKIAIICIVLPMPYIAGEVARIMAERTACTGAEWAALGFMYFVGFLTCLMCYCLTKRNLIRYEV